MTVQVQLQRRQSMRRISCETLSQYYKLPGLCTYYGEHQMPKLHSTQSLLSSLNKQYDLRAEYNASNCRAKHVKRASCTGD